LFPEQRKPEHKHRLCAKLQKSHLSALYSLNCQTRAPKAQTRILRQQQVSSEQSFICWCSPRSVAGDGSTSLPPGQTAVSLVLPKGDLCAQLLKRPFRTLSKCLQTNLQDALQTPLSRSSLAIYFVLFLVALKGQRIDLPVFGADAKYPIFSLSHFSSSQRSDRGVSGEFGQRCFSNLVTGAGSESL
jgi:hypothetical protein